MASEHVRVYLSRRNLQTLLSKLDRKAAGEETACTLVKSDTKHSEYPQTHEAVVVVAVEDADYYTDRSPGTINPRDERKAKVNGSF